MGENGKTHNQALKNKIYKQPVKLCIYKGTLSSPHRFIGYSYTEIPLHRTIMSKIKKTANAKSWH